MGLFGNSANLRHPATRVSRDAGHSVDPGQGSPPRPARIMPDPAMQELPQGQMTELPCRSRTHDRPSVCRSSWAGRGSRSGRVLSPGSTDLVSGHSLPATLALMQAIACSITTFWALVIGRSALVATNSRRVTFGSTTRRHTTLPWRQSGSAENFEINVAPMPCSSPQYNE